MTDTKGIRCAECAKGTDASAEDKRMCCLYWKHRERLDVLRENRDEVALYSYIEKITNNYVVYEALLDSIRHNATSKSILARTRHFLGQTWGNFRVHVLRMRRCRAY